MKKHGKTRKPNQERLSKAFYCSHSRFALTQKVSNDRKRKQTNLLSLVLALRFLNKCSDFIFLKQMSAAFASRNYYYLFTLLLNFTFLKR